MTRSDLLHYISCLFYMGMHREILRDDYWSSSSRLASVMSKTRFDQLHRYLHIRDKHKEPQTAQEGFYWKVEPIATIIRKNCQQNWLPATHISIDEAMLPFSGRSEDTVGIKNKPIKEGFKVWVLADHGYVYNWLWFSGHKDRGTEIIGKKDWKFKIDKKGTTASFAPTFAVVIHLAQLLAASFNRVFVLVLDNLFLNVNVARALLLLNVATCGTIRKNAAGFPPDLIRIKNHNRLYLWDSCVAHVVENVLCFMWQDNNAVLGVTTAHSLHRPEEDTIIRDRKRPKPTSTNARITRPIFGDLLRKELPIPRVIDDYNHHMNGVDLANQLRGWMTSSRPGIYKAWQPLWYWLLDICACNAFLIWKTSHLELDLSSTRLHRKFQESLIQALFDVPEEGHTSMGLSTHGCLPPGHHRSIFPTRSHCQWCKAHPEDRRLKRNPPRRPLEEVVNGVGPGAPRSPSITNSGCGLCGTHLCREGPCFDQWHRQNRLY
jgi:hypothetical protein